MKMLIIWGLTLLVLGQVSNARVADLTAEESEFIDQLIAAGENGELDTSGPQYLDFLRVTGRYEEFAKVMKVEDVNLIMPTTERMLEDPILTKVSPLGDILLTPEQAEQNRQYMNHERHPDRKWPNAVVPYYIGNGEFNRNEENGIRSAYREMNDSLKNSVIRPWKSGDKDYIYIINGKGCYSYLGRIGGSQTLSLQHPGCHSTGTIQHEMQHAMGVAHEHCRPDRDNYVEILWDNIPKDWHSQYEKADSRSFNNNGKYDCCSCMHYPRNAPGTGKPAFRLKSDRDCSCMGQRNGMTLQDKQKMDMHYSK